MPQYVKKPIVIDAFQYDKESINTTEKPSWLKQAFFDIDIYFDSNDRLIIQTLEGNMIVSEGDWIIKGIKNELYPCKDKIFKSTYTQV